MQNQLVELLVRYVINLPREVHINQMTEDAQLQPKLEHDAKDLLKVEEVNVGNIN